MSSRGIVYLDHAGTTPMDSQVLEAMLPHFSQSYGNPSSLHAVGQEARYALDEARDRVAAVLNCRSRESCSLAAEPRPTIRRFLALPRPFKKQATI